jgi:hypothetical protein
MSKIVLKISKHPNGRHTLSKSVDGGAFGDEPPEGPLFGNRDANEFDRETDALADRLRAAGHDVRIEE